MLIQTNKGKKLILLFLQELNHFKLSAVGPGSRGEQIFWSASEIHKELPGPVKMSVLLGPGSFIGWVRDEGEGSFLPTFQDGVSSPEEGAGGTVCETQRR